jgi:phospho-N-acetylmuramoyl-pentapeptide-transferase
MMIPVDVIKTLLPAALSFCIGIAITPIITHYLYSYKVWKKRPGKTAMDGSIAEEFNKLKLEGEKKTPRMGGIVIWGSALITILVISFFAPFFSTMSEAKFNFLSRSQTWIPLAALLIGAFVGIINDYLDCKPEAKGISLKVRLSIVAALACFIGWWFYAKLGVLGISIPFYGVWLIGPFIIPFIMLFAMSIYASGIIDGIDGLSGGVFTSIFTAYAIIAFNQQQYDLAAFSAMIVGSLLAFLWFNIPPARFYMTETGTMSLTLTLTVIAFMTDAMGGGVGVSALLIIGLPLVVTVLSVIAQLFYKKVYGIKLFRIAPLHHHFEAIGWPSHKVTMRYWVVSAICAIIGVVFGLIA